MLADRMERLRAKMLWLRPKMQQMLTYRIWTRWRIRGTLEEVADIWLDAGSLEQWWSDAFLESRVLVEGDADGSRRTFALHTKGMLPYTLRLTSRVTYADYPTAFTVVTWGDLNGKANCHFRQMGPDVEMRCNWKVTVARPLLIVGSFLCKPLLEANHRWVMARGQEGLKRELRRRRGRNSVSPMKSALQVSV